MKKPTSRICEAGFNSKNTYQATQHKKHGLKSHARIMFIRMAHRFVT